MGTDYSVLPRHIQHLMQKAGCGMTERQFGFFAGAMAMLQVEIEEHNLAHVVGVIEGCSKSHNAD